MMIKGIINEMDPIHFENVDDFQSKKIMASRPKIGWIQAMTDSEEADFDIVIKDELGRTKMEKRNCHASVGRFGELLNFPTRVGEKLEVFLENVKGAKKVDLFIN